MIHQRYGQTDGQTDKPNSRGTNFVIYYDDIYDKLFTVATSGGEQRSFPPKKDNSGCGNVKKSVSGDCNLTNSNS